MQIIYAIFDGSVIREEAGKLYLEPFQLIEWFSIEQPS